MKALSCPECHKIYGPSVTECRMCNYFADARKQKHDDGFFTMKLHRSDAEAVQRALYLMREKPVWERASSVVEGWLGIESTFERIIHAAKCAFEVKA